MIIWSGLGILAPIVAFVCMLGMEYLTEHVSQDDHYFQLHAWPKLVGFWIAGVITWLIARVLDPRPGKPWEGLGDLRTNHTFFFIPMELFGPIFFVLGVVCLFWRG